MGASLLTSLYLIRKDPALLKRRLRGGTDCRKGGDAESHHGLRLNGIHRTIGRASF